MNTSKLVCAVMIAFLVPVFSLGAQSRRKPVPQGEVSQEAQSVLNKMQAAYDKLQSLELAGTETTYGEVAAKNDWGRDTKQFQSKFAAPNKFKLEVSQSISEGPRGKRSIGASITMGCTGDLVYTISDGGFWRTTVPAQRFGAKSFARFYGTPEGLVGDEPSLFMALYKDGARRLVEEMGPKVDRGPDEALDGKTYLSLRFESLGGTGIQTVLIDPQSFLIRRRVSIAQSSGRKLEETVDYQTIRVNPKLDSKEFEWSPPAGAKEQR